jgi:carbonic anhydrase
MTDAPPGPLSHVRQDLTAAVVVFIVALPLCLGVALASGAPLISGVVAGIVGGMVVGVLSGSSTSVSGPAAGLTAVVAAQIAFLQSFEAFLLAVFIAGILQIALGVARGGFFVEFVPGSVIKGLLAAIGLILILKQIPHLAGRDSDPEGDMAFDQPDNENTITELLAVFFNDVHIGAMTVGLSCLAVLLLWDRIRLLKKAPVPSALVVVLLGVGLSEWFRTLGGSWAIGATHLVQVPVIEDWAGLRGLLVSPDFSQWKNPLVFRAAIVIAAVASLETLLNLEAVDRIDPRKRISPGNRELIAQGVGNITCGLIGGLPVTSVVVRSSVNIHSGGRTKLSTIVHGVCLLVSVTFAAQWLNHIPLACLAAILFVTGFKLINARIVRQMWDAGITQFAPFVVTVLAIVLTDLLIGVLVGIAVSVLFILNSNVRKPLKRVVERHPGGEVVRIELGNQVSFLNRVALRREFKRLPRGGHVLLDARASDYIDADVLDQIREFQAKAPARGVEVSLVGFKDYYHLKDETRFADYTSREVQDAMTPAKVLQFLRAGHARFRSGQHLTRDFGKQVSATADGQHPVAVVLSCIDSRAPAELLFDSGLGDIFSVRVAGNVTGRKIMGSVEYACAVAGSKLVLVLGHTRCGAVTAAYDLHQQGKSPEEATGCQHLAGIVGDIQHSLADGIGPPNATKDEIVNEIARRNVLRSVEILVRESDALAMLVREGKLAVVGAIYDVTTGAIEFFADAALGPVAFDQNGRAIEPNRPALEPSPL